MNETNCSPISAQQVDSTEVPSPVVRAPRLHRLREVRRQEGITQRTVARRLGTNVSEVKIQEHESTDLPISVLCQWQQVLGVPLFELLVEPGEQLSPPLARRAQLVRLMKTTLSIMEQSTQDGVQCLVQTLIDQLIGIMPELRNVAPWHAVGQRRRRDELGRAAEYVLSEDVFIERGE